MSHLQNLLLNALIRRILKKLVVLWIQSVKENVSAPYSTSAMRIASQSARCTDPMLDQCWAIVCDAGPALNQHWISVPCLLCRGALSMFSHTTWTPLTHLGSRRHGFLCWASYADSDPALKQHRVNASCYSKHNILKKCWASVGDSGSTLNQHCFNTSCLLVSHWDGH